jgi:hypothetical protein
LVKLKEDIRIFIKEVDDFHKDYTDNGPMVPNIEPSEAMNRLKEFKDRYEMNKRKYDIYHNGEALFGMPH